ncbi:MAG: DUF4388 domain-containing protein [Verrucomicrobiota bacterium]|nr:DUF4388 domain-containing protein [Verrucomicrobiota bacterium]
MQLLIVHHDAEVGEQLVQMVKEYTEHHCGLVTSDVRAVDWSRGVPRCSLLITQLQGDGVNGLALGATLSDTFAGLQTMFLPDYAATERRLEIPHTKVFPEPIEGERLLNAIERADEQRRHGLDAFHALDVLQMCCLSRRSGAVQFVLGSKSAIVYLLNGRIVHAERGAARGADALSEIVPWEAAEFAYDYSVRAPAETIAGSWDEALIAAIERRKTPAVGEAAPVGEAARTAPTRGEPKPSRWGVFRGSRK